LRRSYNSDFVESLFIETAYIYHAQKRFKGERKAGLNLFVGRCIYCDETSPPLTREHVLPRGLGGDDSPECSDTPLVLRDASCARCQNITKRIEQDCLVPMMDYARARLGLKRKDRRPATMRAVVDLLDGTTEHREIDSTQILGPIVIPAYYEAGALTSKPLNEFSGCDYHMIIVASAAQNVMTDVSRLGVDLIADSKAFARMLAKIALGVAVAHFGLEGFTPTVRNLILVNPDESTHWVGGFAGTDRVTPPSDKLHRIVLRQPGQLRLGDFIVVEIQLFAKYGAPNNYVVVGKAT
jgi:hypothetical protein